jgi:hypothetical protein
MVLILRFHFLLAFLYEDLGILSIVINLIFIIIPKYLLSYLSFETSLILYFSLYFYQLIGTYLTQSKLLLLFPQLFIHHPYYYILYYRVIILNLSNFLQNYSQYYQFYFLLQYYSVVII